MLQKKIMLAAAFVALALSPLGAMAAPPNATGIMCMAEARAIAARWAPSWAYAEMVERQTQNIALVLGCYTDGQLAASGWGDGAVAVVPAHRAQPR